MTRVVAAPHRTSPSTRDSGRARLPDRVRASPPSSDGVRLAFDVYGARRPDARAPALGADRPLAPVEGPGPVPQPPLPRRRLRRARQRPLGPADRPGGLPDDRGRRRHRGGDGRDRTRTARCSSGCASTACGARSGSRPTHPERVAGIVAFAHRRAPDRPSPAALRRGGRHVRRRAADDRGLGEVQPPPLAARLPRTSPGSSSAEITSEPHSTKVDRGRRRAGPIDGSVEAMLADADAGVRPRPRGGRGGSAARSAARCSSSTAPRTPASRPRARRRSRS